MRKATLAKYAVGIALVLLYLAPLFWMALNSFKTEGEMHAIPPTFLQKGTLAHYKALFTSTSYPSFFNNSLRIAVISTAISILIGCPASYALTRYKFRGADFTLFGILACRMFPPIIFVLPFFFMMQRLHLIDTHLGLVISHLAFQLPLTVWLMQAFFLGVPRVLEEAAQIDGCSRLGTFVRIVLPFVYPGLATTAIVNFIFSWNEFLFAVVVTRMNAKTVPVFIAESVTTFQVLWGQMFSSALLFIAPVIVFTFIIQKHMVTALGGGFIKS